MNHQFSWIRRHEGNGPGNDGVFFLEIHFFFPQNIRSVEPGCSKAHAEWQRPGEDVPSLRGTWETKGGQPDAHAAVRALCISLLDAALLPSPKAIVPCSFTMCLMLCSEILYPPLLFVKQPHALSIRYRSLLWMPFLKQWDHEHFLSTLNWITRPPVLPRQQI